MSFDFSGVPENRFAINIGDTVSRNQPGPGAGSIEVNGGLDVYTFNATPGQQVFFETQAISDTLFSVHWQLTDADGQQIFRTCLGCGNPGVQTLSRGGPYTIVVGNDTLPGTGTYKFKLWNVPPPQHFQIHIGDTVSKDKPATGAGNIESPGVRDIYTFNATAGQSIFVQRLASSDSVATVHWQMVDATGLQIFDSCIGCGNPGVQKLVHGGQYTITVGDDINPGTGTYQFKLWNVPPPQHFQIHIGDTVSKDKPAAGAGNIESPGVRDIYTFNATAGQSIFVQRLASSDSVATVHWQMVDATGHELFSTCIGCGNPGVQKLVHGGQYTITVGDDINPGTGTYQFKLWNVPPPQHFQIHIGDTVSKDKPATGAGNIESPGVRDIYTFNATAGQSIFVQRLASSDSVATVHWQMVDATGHELFSTCIGCGNPGVQKLVHGGQYTITIGEDPNPGTGTYQFKLWNVPPPQHFQIHIGDTVSKDKPATGAGNIESPGVEDIYTFSAAAGQKVFFDMQAVTITNGLVSWRLVDAGGQEIFKTCLGCTMPGTETLSRGGAYTLTVGTNTDAATGIYRFKLWNVPSPQHFSIAIGATVSKNNPGPGAGNIESAGAKDIYSFSASAGQKVEFTVINADNSLDPVGWRLVDSKGNEIFNTCLGCTTPGTKTLSVGGAYTLTAGSDTDPGTGTYSFKLTPK